MTMTIDPLIGRQLGDYRIVDILGRGGMAHVYRGFDKKLQRYAAVKVIDANLFANNESEEEYRERFQREARAIAHLSHPNVVGVYQFGEVGTLYYMAMAFIEGRDLSQILKEQASSGTYMPNEQIAQIIRDIAAALDHAHSQGVIHRDIKPSNIMVMRDGHAVLTDFGLALSVPEGSMGNTFGSAHYIAPEQAISSAKALPQSDIYSLGVVLYQMLTGKVPFDDPSAMSVALKHLSEPPPPVRNYNTRIAPATERVVMKALEKEPSKRFRTGAQMADALIEALYPMDKTSSKSSRPSLAAKISTSEFKRLDNSPTIDVPTSKSRLKSPLKRSNRSRLWIGLVVLLIVVVAGIAIAGGGGGSPTPTAVIAAGGSTTITLPPTVTRTNARTVEVNETPTVPVALIEETVTAEVTITPESSSTDVPPTITDSPTTEPIFTQTPTPEPTVTPLNLETPTQEILIVPTDVPVGVTLEPTGDANVPHVILIYDADQLVILNPSTRVLDFTTLRFVQEMDNGIRRTFSAASIPAADLSLLRSVPQNRCLHIWRDGVSQPARPPRCVSLRGFFQAVVSRQFWLNATTADATFQVLRDDQLLAECPVNAGECRVVLGG